MGLFGFLGLGGNNINQLVEEARSTPGSVILDVRTPAEFKQGHIEGAYNLPLDQIDAANKVVKSLETPLFLYCASGARSSSATRYLKSQGFENVQNMGGISSWQGKVVKGAR